MAWDLLDEPWDALGTWADGDDNGAVSSINPAGQLYLDCRALTDPGRARRSKDAGTYGDIDLTVGMRFKGDVWDQDSDSVGGAGVKLQVEFQTNQLYVVMANVGASGDGVWIYDGADYVKVVTKTWDTNWHTVRFLIHNSQTDVDVYIDTVLAASDGDMTFAASTDGNTDVRGYGTVDGDGEYHIDYIKVKTGLFTALEVDVHDCGDVEEKMGG